MRDQKQNKEQKRRKKTHSKQFNNTDRRELIDKFISLSSSADT